MAVLSEEEGKLAVRIARSALENRLRGRRMTEIPAVSPVFADDRGVFVTLTRGGRLRGCIGYPYPVMPLSEALVNAAVAAATEDPRFLPVSAGELDEIEVEVTVMTPPEPLLCPPAERPSRIEAGRHGLIITGHGRSGLLLPQVATEYGWDEKTFLDHTCMKAGLPSGCWQRDGIEVQTFEGQIFHEQR
jgi:uncharacterized protein (TIGR00296 family)